MLGYCFNTQETLKAAKSNIKVAQDRQKQQYDQKHCRPTKFSVGTKVLRKDFLRKKRRGRGMDYKWLCPYVITKDLSKGFFSLRSTESGKEVRRIHGAHLKQYVTPPNSPQNEPVSIDDQESSSESPNLSIDSPPLLPLPSDVDLSEDETLMICTMTKTVSLEGIIVKSSKFMDYPF